MLQILNRQKYRRQIKTKKCWTKELNLIRWNDREPQYDILEHVSLLIFNNFLR